MSGGGLKGADLRAALVRGQNVAAGVAMARDLINAPPNVWHKATSENGATMWSLFSLTGLEASLAEMAELSDKQIADAPLMQALVEKYDIGNE